MQPSTAYMKGLFKYCRPKHLVQIDIMVYSCILKYIHHLLIFIYNIGQFNKSITPPSQTEKPEDN